MLKKSLFVLLGCVLLTGCSNVKKAEKEVLSFVKETNAKSVEECLEKYSTDQCKMKEASVIYSKKNDIFTIRLTEDFDSNVYFTGEEYTDLYNIVRESGVESDVIIYGERTREKEDGDIEYNACWGFTLNGSHDVDEYSIPSLLREAGIDTTIYWGNSY